MKKKSGWTENTKQKGVPEPKVKWVPQCSICKGRGKIWYPVSKEWDVCPRCDGGKED